MGRVIGARWANSHESEQGVLGKSRFTHVAGSTGETGEALIEAIAVTRDKVLDLGFPRRNHGTRQTRKPGSRPACGAWIPAAIGPLSKGHSPQSEGAFAPRRQM